MMVIITEKGMDETIKSSTMWIDLGGYRLSHLEVT